MNDPLGDLTPENPDDQSPIWLRNHSNRVAVDVPQPPLQAPAWESPQLDGSTSAGSIELPGFC